jgi:hypothetical protein
MKDKNNVIVKHRDIIKINRENFCEPDSLLAVHNSIDTSNKVLEVYNPNCCKVCRAMRGSMIGLDFFKSNEIEVIGNLDTTPELLPLIDLTKKETTYDKNNS